MPKLPGPLRLTSAFPFAGRSRELTSLHAQATVGQEGGLRLALVGGEAGSGKSRLVREFAQGVAADGCLVLYGACDAVVQRPYRPFVEALEQLVRGTETRVLREDLGTAGSEIARLLPELALRIDDLAPLTDGDVDTERHRLHTAVADLLTAVSRRVPLVILIEDLHWADVPTLLLLGHLAHGATDVRGVLVTTFRDTESDVPEHLSAALADLRRAESTLRVRLAGLDAAEILEFVERAAGGALGPELAPHARALHGLTGGNAFLVTEFWRTLIATDALSPSDAAARLADALADLGSPESVVEVVGQRLARLTTATGELLELAAVAGHEFDLPTLRGTAGADPGIQTGLTEALAHGMIEEVPGPRLAYQFTHELVRRALYDRMTGLRRAALHLQVAEALERRFDDTAAGGVAELAHHFTAAAPLDGPRRAVHYSLLAGRAAMATLAFDAAEARFAAALELGVGDPHEQARTQLELGTARFRAGRSGDAMEAFRVAADIARRLGDVNLLAAAAVGFEGACWRPGITDQGAVELLVEASGTLGEADSELRVMVLAGLGRAHAFVGNHTESAIVRARAAAMARRLDDRLGLATVLVRSYWSRGDASLDETLDQLSEARDLAAALGEHELQIDAMEWRLAGLIEQGELQTAALELTAVHAIAERLRQPFPLHVAEHDASTLALCAGRLAEAEAAAHRSHAWSRLLTGRGPSGIHGIQMFGIRREQGRLAELAPLMRLIASSDRPNAWRPGLAALFAELGMDDEARRELTQVRRDGLDALRAALWAGSLSYLADACAAVGDTTLAELVYVAMTPFAGRNIVVGHGVASYGAADRFLGVLANTVGDHGLAVRHLERALAANRAMGATTWVGHTLCAYARTLQRRGRSDDLARASSMLAEATAIAEDHELPAVLTRARSLAATRGSPTAALPDDLSRREVDILRLVAAGRSNREIGEELFISGHTVANHVRSILRKTGTANRTDAAGYAYRHALVEDPEPR